MTTTYDLEPLIAEMIYLRANTHKTGINLWVRSLRRRPVAKKEARFEYLAALVSVIANTEPEAQGSIGATRVADLVGGYMQAWTPTATRPAYVFAIGDAAALTEIIRSRGAGGWSIPQHLLARESIPQRLLSRELGRDQRPRTRNRGPMTNRDAQQPAAPTLPLRRPPRAVGDDD